MDDEFLDIDELDIESSKDNKNIKVDNILTNNKEIKDEEKGEIYPEKNKNNYKEMETLNKQILKIIKYII